VILVDSSVWIDRFRDTLGPEVVLLRHFLASDPAGLAVGDLVLFEVLSGVSNPRLGSTLRQAMLAVTQVELAGLGVIDDAVVLYRTMRRHGVTSGFVDTFIAAWCLRQRCPLLTRDRDFLPMRDHAGLDLVDPARFDPGA
jgi:predicted nucleic acid-binding protein